LGQSTGEKLMVGEIECLLRLNLRIGQVWSAEIESSARGREKVFVMQPAQDRIGANRLGFSAAMARVWMRVVDVGGRRIRNTGTFSLRKLWM
jgi:hypothetical protein